MPQKHQQEEATGRVGFGFSGKGTFENWDGTNKEPEPKDEQIKAEARCQFSTGSTPWSTLWRRYYASVDFTEVFPHLGQIIRFQVFHIEL